MNRLSESDIEDWALEQLEAQGWGYLPGIELAPDSLYAERERFEDVLLQGRLQKALERLNPELPPAALQAALRQVEGIGTTELLVANESFHALLTEGVPVVYRHEGREKGRLFIARASWMPRSRAWPDGASRGALPRVGRRIRGGAHPPPGHARRRARRGALLRHPAEGARGRTPFLLQEVKQGPFARIEARTAAPAGRLAGAGQGVAQRPSLIVLQHERVHVGAPADGGSRRQSRT